MGTEPGLIEAEVYASANRRTVGRMVYTSHIPCNGLEEPKSDEDLGISVEIWFEKDGQKLVGAGHEPNDLSLDAVERALAKAKRDAVPDPEFFGFYKKDAITDHTHHVPQEYHDIQITDMSVADESQLLAEHVWQTIDGAVEVISAYAKEANSSPEDVAFILNGDHFVISEMMAVASTNGVEASDVSTIVLSFLTGMIESGNAKGSAWSAHTFLNDLSPKQLGRDVAQAAIANLNGVTVESGTYSVIFGPQAVAELFGSLLLPHLTLGMVDFGVSLFADAFEKKVATPLLSIYDDATMDRAAGTKRVTCEGVPTARVPLIESGVLKNLLSDYRTTSKFLHTHPDQQRSNIEPRNGFRFGFGGGRVAGAGVGTHATNLVIDSPTPLPPEELLVQVKDGIYIGRLWYTYPVGGYASGIISGTAIADNFVIKDGKRAEPIVPNTLRLQDNLQRMITNIIGVGNNQVPTVLWASDEVTHAPWVAIADVPLSKIGG